MATTKVVAEAFETLLVGLNDSGTPTPNYYFDHVWVGKPKKIPMGARAIAIVEISEDPTFYYTTCTNAAQRDTDVILSIYSKGEKETSTKYLYDLRDVVITGLLAAPTLGGKIIHSTIERVVYGDVIENQKNLIAACRIYVRCKVDDAA